MCIRDSLEAALFLSFLSAFLGGIVSLRPLLAFLLRSALRASLFVSAFLEEHVPHFFWDFSQIRNQLWGWVFWLSLLGFFIFLIRRERKKLIWGSVLVGVLLVGGLYLFLPPPCLLYTSLPLFYKIAISGIATSSFFTEWSSKKDRHTRKKTRSFSVVLIFCVLFLSFGGLRCV